MDEEYIYMIAYYECNDGVVLLLTNGILIFSTCLLLIQAMLMPASRGGLKYFCIFILLSNRPLILIKNSTWLVYRYLCHADSGSWYKRMAPINEWLQTLTACNNKRSQVVSQLADKYLNLVFTAAFDTVGFDMVPVPSPRVKRTPMG